ISRIYWRARWKKTSSSSTIFPVGLDIIMGMVERTGCINGIFEEYHMRGGLFDAGSGNVAICNINFGYLKTSLFCVIVIIDPIAPYFILITYKNGFRQRIFRSLGVGAYNISVQF